MHYTIAHESKKRIRIKLCRGPLSDAEEEILRFAFSGIPGVRAVTVYKATAGCAILYEGSREDLIHRLDLFQFQNVEMLARTVTPSIDAKEMRERKLDPAFKRRLRARILAETAADLLLPVPLQLGYHAWQMITLREF